MPRRSLPTEILAVTRCRGRRRLCDAIACVLLLCTAAALIWNLHDTHFPSAAEITSQRVIVMQTEDGRDLLTKGSFRLAPIAAKDMPVNVINAIVSIEDRHFYRHGGIDVPSTLRACSGNIKAGHIVRRQHNYSAARQDPFSRAAADVRTQDPGGGAGALA